MAKPHNKTVTAALTRIQSTGRATLADKPLADQGLIEVNKDDIVNDEVAARLTQKGLDGMPKAAVTNVGAAPAPSNFAIITNATPPESKRGVGRVAGPSKYPFEQLQKGSSFFVAASAEVPNPLKTLGSAVANATNKHRVDSGNVKEVERTKRGVTNPDGSKIKETVKVPVYNYPVKFVIRGVKAQQKCGEWVAPSDGVLITRTV